MPDTVTPQEIMDLLYDVTGRKAEIEPACNGPGFQVETDMGSSFSFEIYSDTEAQVARKYFDHCIHVYGYTVEQSKSFWWRIFKKFTQDEVQECERTLARLHAWRETHLADTA